MSSKFISLGALFLLLSLLPASYAHAAVSPALGVKGTPKRSDAKRPSKANPCGAGVNIASALDASTAVPAAANGEIKVTAINFNAGADGSRKVTAQVDPSGTGKKFVNMVVTVNGDPAPKEKSAPQEVLAQLPAATTCTGGAKKDRCLVQFVTTSGFGNCVAVSQGAASNTTSISPAPKATPPVAGSPAAAVAAAKRAKEPPVRAVKKDDKEKKAAAKKAEKGKKAEKDKKNADKKKGAKSDVKKSTGSVKAVKGSGKKEAAKKKKDDKKKVAKKDKKAGKKKVAAAKKEESGDKAKVKDDKKPVGTRAARALLDELEKDLREKLIGDLV